MWPQCHPLKLLYCHQELRIIFCISRQLMLSSTISVCCPKDIQEGRLFSDRGTCLEEKHFCCWGSFYSCHMNAQRVLNYMVWLLVSYPCCLHQTAYLIMALVFSAPLTVCQGTEAFRRNRGQDAARWIFWHLRHFLTVICRGQARSGEYEEEKGRGGAQGTHGGHGEHLGIGRCFLPSPFHVLREIPMLTTCCCFMFFSLSPLFGIILFSNDDTFPAVCLVSSQGYTVWLPNNPLLDSDTKFSPGIFTLALCRMGLPPLHARLSCFWAASKEDRFPSVLPSWSASSQTPSSSAVCLSSGSAQWLPWHLLQPTPAVFLSGQP